MFRFRLRKTRQSREERVLSMVIREINSLQRVCNCALETSIVPNERVRASFGVEIADSLLKAIDRELANGKRDRTHNRLSDA